VSKRCHQLADRTEGSAPAEDWAEQIPLPSSRAGKDARSFTGIRNDKHREEAYTLLFPFPTPTNVGSVSG
jgi:hypothetical protein